MADIATLGLTIDSRPVTDAARALDSLSMSARGTEQAVGGLERSTGAAASGSQRLEQDINRARAAADDLGISAGRASGVAQRFFVVLALGALLGPVTPRPGAWLPQGCLRAHPSGRLSSCPMGAAPPRLLPPGLRAAGTGSRPQSDPGEGCCGRVDGPEALLSPRKIARLAPADPPAAPIGGIDVQAIGCMIEARRAARWLPAT